MKFTHLGRIFCCLYAPSFLASAFYWSNMIYVNNFLMKPVHCKESLVLDLLHSVKLDKIRYQGNAVSYPQQ